MHAMHWFVAMSLLIGWTASESLAAVTGRHHQRYHHGGSGSGTDAADSTEYEEPQQAHHQHRQHHQHQQQQQSLPEPLAQQQQLATKRVLNLEDTKANWDEILSGFNITRTDLLNRVVAQPASSGTPRPSNGIEQQKIDFIKEEIMVSIGRNVSPSQDPSPPSSFSDGDPTISNVAFYPSCNHYDDVMGISPNTTRMYFPHAIIGRLGPRMRLDMAVLRIYQIPHERNLPTPVSCAEPNDRVFFTVSVIDKRGSGKDAQYRKRNCHKVTRNLNNSSWIDLDVIEVLRHWQRPQRQGGASGRAASSIEPMLLIDVHDQFDNELNAAQFFEPMDCQASHQPTPWALYEEPTFNLSKFELPHVPRLDLTTRQFVQRPGRERSLHSSYVDRFHRLEQLPHNHQYQPQTHQALAQAPFADAAAASASSAATDDDSGESFAEASTTRRPRHNSSSRRRKQRRAHEQRHHRSLAKTVPSARTDREVE